MIESLENIVNLPIQSGNSLAGKIQNPGSFKRIVNYFSGRHATTVKYRKPAVRIVASILLLVSPLVKKLNAVIYYVNPGQSIQTKINDPNVVNGDEIIVYPGTYVENINFNGKNIVLRSTVPNDLDIVAKTILDGMRNGLVVTFENSEDPNCVLSGFKITNGGGSGRLEDGGIACYYSSPRITHNMIEGNWGGEWGGGIYCEGSSPLIENNTIRNNYSEFSGGIDCWYNSSPIIIGNRIIGNYADFGMGAIQVRRDSSPIILNNVITLNFGAGIGIYLSNKQTTILNNTIVGTLPSDYEHAGIRVYESVTPIIRNCILWENGDELKGCAATYSCIKGNDTGESNISQDPYFADPNNDDYHLKSQAGRWDPNKQEWVQDGETSPCIDAGDPLSPIMYEPFPNGGRINMGAYGGTAEASKSYFGKPNCETIVAGDINGDCKVDFKDFAIMAYHWLEDRRGE